MTMDPVMVEIGSGTSARIVLSPQARLQENATDFWDANRIDSTIAVRAGGFRGEYRACLRTDEFVSFRRDLERLYRELRGEGSFHSLEGWIEIDLTGDGRGYFRGECRLRDDAGMGNRLECEVTFDQTDVPEMIASLRRVEAAFPVLGDPPES